jgi:type IV pilus assembly protein PilB
VNLLALLVEQGYLDEREVSAISQAAEERGVPVETILAERGIDAASVLAAQGQSGGVPTYALDPEASISPDTLAYIPEESAKHYQAVPLGVVDGALHVGMLDPDNIQALDALNFISAKNNMPFKAFLITQEDFDRVLDMYHGIGGQVNRALTEIDTEGEGTSGSSVDLNQGGGGEVVEQNQQGASAAEQESPAVAREDAPVTKIVTTMIRNAVDGRASDIHIEHTGEQVRVRFRVDGVLHTSIILPAQVHRAVVSRIKILSSLKLDERRKPQDGRFSATLEGRKVDFRVSTFPTRFGEKVVMRILDSEKGINKLEQLGLSEEHLSMVRTAVEKPYGMILVTGPTGSGKSTTLYSMLAEVDTEGKNVLSLEDPVEYNIAGVSQSQVRADIGYTFASGLRSILRQDPDVIMVGEIRDKETAQLAVQAALTGHLVLSTLHTNTAIGAVPRLIDMGVDPYLIAPTLELLIGQRLLRKMCPDSGRKIPVTGAIERLITEQFADLPEQYRRELPLDQDYIWGMQPTGDCPSGTRGRTAVHEMVAIDRDFEDAILNSANENKLYDLARKKGFISMRERAIVKALEREVPLEEINTLGGGFAIPAEEGEESPEEHAPVNEIAV